MADIQAPPASTYTPIPQARSRRSVTFSMSIVEVPEQMVRKTEQYGANAGWTYGVIDGYRRAFKRFGYGWYELVTFYCPTYKGTFKPPYERCGEDHRIEMNPHDGLSEFPPTLGFDRYYHVRTQKW